MVHESSAQWTEFLLHTDLRLQQNASLLQQHQRLRCSQLIPKHGGLRNNPKKDIRKIKQKLVVRTCLPNLKAQSKDQLFQNAFHKEAWHTVANPYFFK